MTKRAAVTGGTGFVGAALIAQLQQQGWTVAALARDPRRLQAGPGVEIVSGDLADAGALARLAEGAEIFIHLAGVTHARKAEDYHQINAAGAERAAMAARAAGGRFIHASSLSAREPAVSPYARSKAESEQAVRRAAGENWLALRLPAIYGPRDMVTLPYFKLVKAGLALEPKTREPARASILNVADAAAALIAAATADAAGAVFEVGDEMAEGRAWSQIGATLAAAFGREARAIRVPRPAIAAYHSLLRSVEGALGRTPSVREGQINEFFHPDWVARENLLSDACGWRPQTPLKEGFTNTIRWYQEHDLL